MTRLRTPALCILLLSSAACSFHGSYSTGTSSGGSPEAHEHASRPREPREHRSYTAPPANHVSEVACTSGDDATKARCEERKKKAQEELDAIDRETQERDAQAEADARRQEEEADAEAARQRKQAEDEAAQRQREAENQAAQPPDRHFQENGSRDALANAVAKQPIAASSDSVAAPRQGQTEAPATIEHRKSDLKQALERQQSQIDKDNAEKKAKIKKALGRTKADILVAAQRKRNEVHASLKEAASSP